MNVNKGVQMKTKIKPILFFMSLTAILMSGCALTPAEDPSSEPFTNMANPASVFCEEQGFQLEMREDANGTYGVCIFPDGSECEEWAYFRGECQPGNSETGSQDSEDQTISQSVVALYGNIIASDVEVPAPSILVIRPEGIATIYITGENGDIENQIIALQDKPEPANKASFWGKLQCPSLENCLLTVTSMQVDGPGAPPEPDQVEAWEGVIYSGPPGPRSGGDDYFALLGKLPFEYGIDSNDDALKPLIEQFRDTGQAVRISGQLFAGRPDWNSTQIIVTWIEPIEVNPSLIPPAPEW